MKQKNKKRRFLTIQWNLLILVTFALLSLLSVGLIRTKLLQNMQEMGEILTRNYSAEQQNNITVYQTMLELGVAYIDEEVLSGSSEDEIQQWLHRFFENITQARSEKTVDPYAVINGKIIAAQPWEGDATYAYEQATWYQKALEADGAAIFTDVYQDAITGKSVITLAQKASHSDSVLAFDIFVENFYTADNPIHLPEGSSYYLCDQSGSVLYYTTEMQIQPEAIQGYVSGLVAQITKGELEDFDASIYDLEGNRQGVYYDTMSNGWISVLTIPFDTILKNLSGFLWLMTALFVGFLAMVLFVTIRNSRIDRAMKRTDETVHALGNFYYAIYRVDTKQSVYEIIKCPEDIKQYLPLQDSYDILLQAISRFVSEKTFQNFTESFSLPNLKRILEEHDKEYGGDFLRLFADTEKWVNVQVLFDETFDADEVVLCFRVVDREKRQQLDQLRLLQSALDSAKRSTEAKTAFFNHMSHDMRTPLNAILGLSELVEHDLEHPNKVSDYMHKISLAGRQLLGLVNDVLDISSIEQGALSLDYQAFDIQQCVTDATAIFQEEAKRAQKEFTVSFDIQQKQVLGDSFRIGQILNNLLSNAFKYSNKGDHISLQVKQDNYLAKYTIMVSDTGVGMSETFLEHIFEPYARETQFGAKNISGTGLGMPIVKSLVLEMQGEISVKSTLGKGSTFTIVLPLQPAQQEEAIPIQAVEKQSFSLEGKKILLAEDNEINMEIAVAILTMNGVDVVSAYNGKEAVDVFAASPVGTFDAVLMDMQMPEMNGCEATKAIRALPREDATQIPIIAVTANAFAEDIALTAEAGMNAHISKPIDFTVLCTTLEQWIQKRKVEK